MIKYIKFNNDSVKEFFLKVKNIIDNDFNLKHGMIFLPGVLLVFDDIIDSEDSNNIKISFIKEGSIVFFILSDVFDLYDYVINYVPYKSLNIVFTFKNKRL